MTTPPTYTAFAAGRMLFRGPLVELLATLKLATPTEPGPLVLIFDNATGRQVDFDLRGSLEEVLERVRVTEPPRSPGRPRLGVEGREVTLLPRHWAWLDQQPKGASAALRLLVEQASKATAGDAAAAKRRDATYSVMSALAGDLPGFEEASRALFQGNLAGFRCAIAEWPADIRGHLEWLHRGAATGEAEEAAGGRD